MRTKRRQVAEILLVSLLSASLVAPSVAQATEEQTRTASEKVVTSVETVSPGPVKLGSVSLGAFYSYSSGCAYPYSCYPNYFWDPFYTGFWPSYWYYPPIYPPFYVPGYSGSGQGGEVRLETSAKTAEVYLNSAFAGIAGQLKSFWLAEFWPSGLIYTAPAPCLPLLLSALFSLALQCFCYLLPYDAWAGYQAALLLL